MRVLIHGYYGAGNAGDDAILHAVVEGIHRLYPACRITVSVRSNQHPAYYGPVRVDYVSGDALPKLYRAVAGSDLVLVGGGGLFQDVLGYRPLHLFAGAKGSINYYAAPVFMARIAGVPSILYAVGVGPFRSAAAANATKWVAEAAGRVTVRDAESARLLERMGVSGVTLAADPAINLPVARSSVLRRCAPPGSGPLVGLNVRTWFDRTAKAVALMREVALHLIRSHRARLIILPFNRNKRELALARHLAQSLPAAAVRVIPYDHSPAVLKGVCADLDLMVAMRLHACILATGAGTPTVALSYDPKVARYFAELGLNRYAVHLDAATPKLLCQLADEVLAERAARRADLGERVLLLKQRDADHNLGALRAVLG